MTLELIDSDLSHPVPEYVWLLWRLNSTTLVVCNDSIPKATVLQHSPCYVEFHCFVCSHLALITMEWNNGKNMKYYGMVDDDGR